MLVPVHQCMVVREELCRTIHICFAMAVALPAILTYEWLHTILFTYALLGAERKPVGDIVAVLYWMVLDAVGIVMAEDYYREIEIKNPEEKNFNSEWVGVCCILFYFVPYTWLLSPLRTKNLQEHRRVGRSRIYPSQ